MHTQLHKHTNMWGSHMQHYQFVWVPYIYESVRIFGCVFLVWFQTCWKKKCREKKKEKEEDLHADHTENEKEKMVPKVKMGGALRSKDSNAHHVGG